MKLSSLGLLLTYASCWVAACHGGERQNIPVAQLDKAYQLVGKLHVPLGQVVEVEGVAVQGMAVKGYEGGPNLRVQTVQGRATQQDIQITISPYFTNWGKKGYAGGRTLPKLKMGETYQMEGYEVGGYVGTPAEAYKNAGFAIQNSGYYFRTYLVVYKAKLIEPLRFTPADFRGRHALMQGTARTRDHHSVMEGDGWSVLVAPNVAWPEHVEGKLIETYGLYNSDANPPKADAKLKQFTLVDGTWRLVRLEDQLGRSVALRGRARPADNGWCFHYRGTDLYVENMTHLPGWAEGNHGPMIIRGTLDKAKLPRLDRAFSNQSNQDLMEYYVVRKASWEPLPDELLGVERPIDDPIP